MNSSRTSARPLAVALALGLGLASSLLGAAVPASARTAAAPPAAAGTSVARYDGSGEEAANNKAFFEAVLKSVAEKRAAQPNAQAVTVSYNASRAPSFRSQIASAAAIWNSSESHVKLQEASSGADFSYYEGNDQRGSYASSNGHGSGYIFLDYTQSRQYDAVRVVAHETGHVLGLPDDYSGPCSELMSGGGAGPSCTNRYPNAAERSRVDQLWAAGPAQAPGTVNQPATQPGTAPSVPSTPSVPTVPTVTPGQGPWGSLLGVPWS
ncbi:snapalysin [Streptomyces shenzhenensis]|uniref:snapalysin n=1 Tax=Streptomyces shenzhenensis TaxID=943815 RepID=UPI001F2DF00D